MEHCSYELSTQLRDAGFPQPEPQAGPVWYRGTFKTPFIIIFDKEALDKRYREHGYHKKNKERGNFEGFCRISSLTDGSVGDIGLANCVYAPTALDILKELGGQYPPFVYYGKIADLWSCLDREPLILSSNKIMQSPIGFSGKSAVVAISKFWLHKNKKS